MFKFSKSVDKQVDQELEEGELSDNDVDVVNSSAPVSIQPKPHVQPTVHQQSGSQEYVFETVTVPASSERKKDRKELKAHEKNREPFDTRARMSKSPEPINYQPPPIPPAQPYYSYPPPPYPSYPHIDPRAYPYAIQPPIHQNFPYQSNNYGTSDPQWPKQNYPSYQYQNYNHSSYQALNNSMHKQPNTPYSNNLSTMNQGPYGQSSKYFQHMQSSSPYRHPNYSVSSHENPQKHFSPTEIPPNNILNQQPYKIQTLADKRKAYEEQKKEKKKAREQKIKNKYIIIRKKVQEYISQSPEKEEAKGFQSNKITEENKKEFVSEILYILKGVIKQDSSESIGENTVERIDQLMEKDEKLREMIYEILENLGTTKIQQKLREREIEKKLIGAQKLKKYKERIKKLDYDISKDPRLRS